MESNSHTKKITMNRWVASALKLIFIGLMILTLHALSSAQSIKSREEQVSKMKDMENLNSGIAQSEKAKFKAAKPDIANGVVLEDEKVKAVFDSTSGALLQFVNKKTGWEIQRRPKLGVSFLMHAPSANRRWNPIEGADQKLASVKKGSDGKSVTFVWKQIKSPTSGTLDITFTSVVSLADGRLTFRAELENHSPNVVETVQYPYIGDLTPPSKNDTLRHRRMRYGDLPTDTIYPEFRNRKGYWGVDHPMQTGRSSESLFTLIENGKQGLYVGVYETAPPYLVEYTYELKPGVRQSIYNRVPTEDTIDGLPVHLEFRTVHFPFVNSGEKARLSPIVFEPYEGPWQSGADIYKEWRKTWYKRPRTPAWADDIHSWIQLHINSPEDDFRVPYKDLVKIGDDCVRHGVKAIQLVGWNIGGQDRGDPSHEVDPGLGTWQELHDAIAAVQSKGVKVVLFCKFTWSDITTDWYRKELKKHTVKDPYGYDYLHGGYTYQTPTQLAGINPRRFAVTCTRDKAWHSIAVKEFQKGIALGADGMLYDECQHHGPALYCFSPDHGHHVPAFIHAGDNVLAGKFREVSRKEAPDYLFSGEGPYDLELLNYSLSYFRIGDGSIPAARYIDSQTPLMIAATGFDDREMINRALMYRYIISYEPYCFKGRLDDYPLTVSYGEKVDAFRRRYRAYLWDAEFRDILDANVKVGNRSHRPYSVFRQASGKRAVVIVNQNQNPDYPIEAVVEMKNPGTLVYASPEEPEARPSNGKVTVPARSVVVVMEK